MYSSTDDIEIGIRRMCLVEANVNLHTVAVMYMDQAFPQPPSRSSLVVKGNDTSTLYVQIHSQSLYKVHRASPCIVFARCGKPGSRSLRWRSKSYQRSLYSDLICYVTTILGRAFTNSVKVIHCTIESMSYHLAYNLTYLRCSDMKPISTEC